MRFLAILIGLGLVGIYVLSPIDLLPLNPVDDAVVVVAGLSLVLKGFGMEEKAPRVRK